MTNFSYQLYSSRKFPPLSDTLKMLAGTGYKNVEGYGALYADKAKVDELTANLSANGLKMPTGHFGIDQLEKEPDRVLEIAKAVGIKAIYCPYIMPDQRPDSGKGWHAFGQRLQKAAAPYRAAGLGFGWHNHDFEFKKTADGVLPQTALFEGAPDLQWEADIAWVIKGGADPIEWIRTMKDRITAVHVKDIAPAGLNEDEDGWADLGQGIVDWKALMTTLKTETEAKYYVMEHDNPTDDKRFARRSLAATKTL